MKFKILPAFFSVSMLLSCASKEAKKQDTVEIKGTWKLISATTVTAGKSTFNDFTKDSEMIKIINDGHFAFLKHDLKLNKKGKNNFDAGGGKYKLEGDQYTESLDFYNDKNWEGKTFVFKVKIQNDTLFQTGIEKVEAAGVDRSITEKYLKIADN
jgi:hypothetical protein